MLTEQVLLESRALRSGMSERIEALDKVKALRMLPDGLHVTTRMVAGYYEVEETTVRALVTDHRDELEACGYLVLHGADLQGLKSDFKSLYSCELRARASLALFPRRAVLLVGMLLRDSRVARDVRAYLLDAEAGSSGRPAGGRPEDRGREIDALFLLVADGRERLARLEALVRNSNRVVCAMSSRLAVLEVALGEVVHRLGRLGTTR